MLRNYAKSCLKRKKLLEILQVAKKLASNLWKALGRRGRGRGGGVGGYSIKLCSERLRPEVQSLTLKYTIFDKRYPFRVSSIKKLYPLYLLRENKSVRKEVFRSFSLIIGSLKYFTYFNLWFPSYPTQTWTVIEDWRKNRWYHKESKETLRLIWDNSKWSEWRANEDWIK